MNTYDIISKTKRKQELTDEEIKWFITNYVNGCILDYQVSAWLMAVCLNSLTERETTALTLSMRDSGAVLDLSVINGIKVDKHSTGGVGDKTTLIIAPTVAACGVFVPKMSGRGLGHTGGTIDKLESIPGFKTELPFETFIDTVNTAGFSVVSQSGGLVPADKKLYALRDTTATVDSIPLICSSIMSKKLATGADCILLDVKFGSGAFMKDKKSAEVLAASMIKVGELAGKKCSALVTDMNAPLGRAVGNSLEVIEAIELLKGNDTSSNLYKTCIDLAANMLLLANKSDSLEKCIDLAKDAISSGKALERLAVMIEMQGGNANLINNYTLLPTAKNKYELKATHDGILTEMNSERVGLTALELGAGRKTKADKIDLSAGIYLNKIIGEEFKKGDIIATMYSSTISDFSQCANSILL